MINTTPNVPTKETLKFVLEHVDPTDLNVLEVGCGDGDFALELKTRGANVIALDTDEDRIKSALKKGVEALCTDFLKYKTGKLFDLVIFTRSLHHIHELEQALRRAKGLLKPDRLLLLEEFDVNQMDQRTARWYYNMITVLAESKIINESNEYVEDSLQQWKHDHHHDHELHTGRKMIGTIERIFGSCVFNRGPYLYRSICGNIADEHLIDSLTKKVLRIESELIAQESILPNGLRVIART